MVTFSNSNNRRLFLVITIGAIFQILFLVEAHAAKCKVGGVWYPYDSIECSGGGNGKDSNYGSTATPPNLYSESSLSQSLLSAGQTGKDGGLIFTLESWKVSLLLQKRGSGEIRAKNGAKFVVAHIKLKNDGKESVDIHCKFHLGSALFDNEGRKFDHIDSLYNIEGNTGCNDKIQPGFGSHEMIAFELPETATPNYLMFWDPQEVTGEGKDSFGKKTAVRFRLQYVGNGNASTPESAQQKTTAEKSKAFFGLVGKPLALNFQNIEIRSLLQVLSDFIGIKISVDDTVTGATSIYANNIPWTEVLFDVIDKNHLFLIKVRSGYYVCPGSMNHNACSERAAQKGWKPVEARS